MGKETKFKRARTLLLNEGQRVNYKGADWLYLHEMGGAAARAVAFLERHQKLVRWSKKTPGLVRLLGESRI